MKSRKKNLLREKTTLRKNDNERIILVQNKCWSDGVVE
jgi:hypothetical protein